MQYSGSLDTAITTSKDSSSPLSALVYLTCDYVECHSRMPSSQQSLPHVESNAAPNQPHGVFQAPTHQDTKQNHIHTAQDELNITPIYVKQHTSSSRAQSMNHQAV